MARRKHDFRETDKIRMLLWSDRHCCLCGKVCGTDIEIAHIDENGPGEIDNAIPLCYDCHAEIGRYNKKHPRGNKYKPDELKARDMKQGWPVLRDQGPQAFLDHLEQVQHWTNVTLTSDIGQNAEAAHEAYRDWGRINLRLYATLATTVVAIGLCFIALPFTPKLGVSSWAPHILILSVGLGIVCLLLYVWLIYAMVKRPE